MCPATIKSKHPKDSFWIVWVITLVVIVLLSSKLHATEDCQVWNFDTESCETYAEQNTTLVKEWIEFY